MCLKTSFSIGSNAHAKSGTFQTMWQLNFHPKNIQKCWPLLRKIFVARIERWINWFMKENRWCMRTVMGGQDQSSSDQVNCNLIWAGAQLCAVGGFDPWSATRWLFRFAKSELVLLEELATRSLTSITQGRDGDASSLALTPKVQRSKWSFWLFRVNNTAFWKRSLFRRKYFSFSCNSPN